MFDLSRRNLARERMLNVQCSLPLILDLFVPKYMLFEHGKEKLIMLIIGTFLKRLIGLGILVLSLAFGSGCSLSPTKLMSGYFEKLKISIFQQEDVELVRQGMPTLILMLDASLADDPNNPELLLTASTTYSTYAQAFTGSDGDENRAAILYGRAKEYALKLLSQRKFFADALIAPYEKYEKAMKKFSKKDVPDLYAAGNAWIGWILSRPDSMEALAQLPRALELMRRVLKLNENYADGGTHMLFGIYYAVQPPGAGRDMKKSLHHFKRAIELSGENNLLAKVTFAEFYATAMQDEKLFDNTLNEVLEAKNSTDNDKKLINSVARERARKLLKKKGSFF